MTTVNTTYTDYRSPFYDCANLKKVTFAEGTTAIPSYILNEAAYVTDIVIPETVTVIGTEAFRGCTSLTSIKLPSKLENIGRNAFSGDTALETITLPDTLKEIGGNAFASCSRLTEVTIPKNLTTVNTTYTDYRSPFYNCTNLTKATIADGSSVVADYLFNGCSTIKTVYIPSSVTQIGKNSFKNCSAELTIHGYTNSFAETFATSNNIPFVSVGIVDIITPTAPVSPSTVPTAPTTPSAVPTAPVTPSTVPTAPTTPSAVPTAPSKPTTVPVGKPGKVTVTKTTRNSSKKATIKFKAVKNAVKYQIVYSTSKKFTKANKKTTKATTVSLTNLKKGKVYYVKVRAYAKNAKGKLVSGAYSSVKKIAKK